MEQSILRFSLSLNFAANIDGFYSVCNYNGEKQ